MTATMFACTLKSTPSTGWTGALDNGRGLVCLPGSPGRGLVVALIFRTLKRVLEHRAGRRAEIVLCKGMRRARPRAQAA
jgi:hypothetical protein